MQTRKGDRVYIQATTAASPLILELSKAFIRCGANVFPVVEVPGMAPILFENASDEQLQWVPDPFKLAVETFEIRIAIASAVNTKELSGVDPAKQALRGAAMRPLMQTFMDRSATGELRWNVCMFPTDAYAQDAEMSLADFEDFVYGACLCDQDDPVAAWKEVGRKQQVLVDYLKGKKEVHLVGEGTDVTVGIEGRTFVNCEGDRNMPDGEVFTGPEETKINGHVSFSFPAVYQGREVQGVQVWFEDGLAVKWSAVKNEEFLHEDAHHGRGQPPPRRVRVRHELRHPALHQEHPVRRKDRRHDPHGVRQRLPGNGVDEPLGDPLGHDLRPAPRQRR